ncbi:uncharacterized protein LOC116256188 isoform X3 [Nymphaea colorata]|uniref:uncharacterized protein LOC116256188 isoform X3 n=1 Tax=Nymphaea colorata TaxID=210225 RepID=UPI00129EEA47|nr:uncharacterized protein LOC116256188 isoform X3 [Nymphaea colorata]
MDVFLPPLGRASLSLRRNYRAPSCRNQFFFTSLSLLCPMPPPRPYFPPSSSCFLRKSRGIPSFSTVHPSSSDVLGDWDEDEEEEDYVSDNEDFSVAAYGELEEEARELARKFVLTLDRELTLEEDRHDRKTSSGRKGTRASEIKHVRGGVLTVAKSQSAVIGELAITTTIGMDNIPLASREAAIARMPTMIEKQAAAAVEEASVIIFLVDGQAGPTAADVEIADWLRKNHSDKRIILSVNKCESPRKGLIQASEFWSLGFSPLPISAISGTGTGELLDLVCSELKVIEEQSSGEAESRIPAIAIVGRPNVGKSSILNALLGEDRTIVSPISGTTRDAIDTEFTTPDGQKYRLIDTAGIRRRAAVASAGSMTETLSVNRAFRAIRHADIVALVIEAMACITEQDCNIAERIEKEGKGCIIVVNKWDTIPNKNHQTATYYEQDVREKLRSLDWAPIVYSTATTGQSVDKIISAASTVEQERSRRLGTSILNQVVQEALAFKPPPKTRGGRRGRVYYTTQAAICPPTFVFFVNDAKLFPETYRRYMEKQLRSDAGFTGTPIRLLWRSKKKMGKVEGKVTGTSTQASARGNAARLEMAR